MLISLFAMAALICKLIAAQYLGIRQSHSCSVKPCHEQTLNLAFARVTISAASLNM